MSDYLPTFPIFPSNTTSGDQSAKYNRFAGTFPDPFLDYSSTQMPRSLYDVMRWAEFVWVSWGVYRTAAQRVVRYFLTKIEIVDASDNEKEKFDEFLEKLGIIGELAIAGDNFMTYGNEFLSLQIPFRRHLRCEKCHSEYPIQRVDWNWTDWGFHGTCPNPKCEHKGEFKRVDRTSVAEDKPKLKHWNVHEIRTIHNEVTGRTDYMWEIPERVKAFIKKGNKFYLEDTPWEVIEAIRKNEMFRFNPDVIFHLKDHSPSGVRTHGWGVPLIMSNFRQAWYIQVLKRFNEAIAMDYIIPFRVITPEPGTSREADPLLHMNIGMFNNKVLEMFKKHRRDPVSLHALPFPVRMTMLGADGKALSPQDLIVSAMDEFLNAQGVPAELYRGSLSIQAMPVALRLFERTWVHLVHGLNQLVQWLADHVCALLNWESVGLKLQPVTLADDLEKKQIQLQLASGHMISRQTAYAPFGINFREEIRRMFEEEEYSQQVMQEFSEDQAQRQELHAAMQQGAAGVAPPGAPGGPPMQAAPAGAPMPGGAMPAGGALPMGAGQPTVQGPGVTPQDLTLQAENIAMQLISAPYAVRRAELLNIKKTNETLHALVMQKLTDVRQQAASVGQQQVLSQMAPAAG
jgi:hypothetical protein